MKILRVIFVLMLSTVTFCSGVCADEVLHRFELWGTMNPVDKFNFYLGFTNGYFALRGQKGLELAACLENMGSTQAIAMIDKRYKDHPEKWSSAIGMEVLTGLTV